MFKIILISKVGIKFAIEYLKRFMTMSCDCCNKKSVEETGYDRDWGLYMIKVGFVILIWIALFCYGYSYFYSEDNNIQQTELVEENH